MMGKKHSFLNRIPGFAGLLLIVAGPKIVAQESVPMQLVAYAHVRPPVSLSLPDLPEPFTQQAYTLLLLSREDNPYPLHWVVAMPEGEAGGWREPAGHNGWPQLEQGAYVFFAPASLGLKSGDPVWPQLMEAIETVQSTPGAGGLVSGWKRLLPNISRHPSARADFASGFLPFVRENDENFGTYVQWWLDELTAIRSIGWVDDLSPRGRIFTLHLSTEPGSREHRLLTGGPPTNLELLDFVPADAETVTFLRIHSERAANFLNFLYQGTNLITDEGFRQIRESLDTLDAGFFDLWDGEWVLWSPAGSSGRMFMTNGRYVSSDLSDLFAMFERLSEAAPGLSMVLDENNSVVGFTRIRSLDWRTTRTDGATVQRSWFFGIINGRLLVSDKEDLMTDLVFKLSSRRREHAPARNLVDGYQGYAYLSFREGELTESVRLNEGDLEFQQASGTAAMDWILRWMFKMCGF